MRSSAILYLAVLVSAVYGLPRRYMYDDKCTQNPESGQLRIDNPFLEVRDYDVNMTCTNGSIYWNYPIGTIDLHFRENTSFSVCFRDYLGADYLEFSDITDGGDRPLPRFNRDHPNMENCVNSINDKVDIKMFAPTRAYMAAMLYSLK